MRLHEFENRVDCEQALLNELLDSMQSTLSTQPELVLAVAGGNTPKQFYQTLSKQKLDWNRVRITLTDERWVSPEHSDSNENMLSQTLLTNNAIDSRYVPLKNSAETPEQGQGVLQSQLSDLIPTLDYVILGMGDDGHFASIFPNMHNTQDLLNTKQDALCLPAHPQGKPARMSLTMAYLLSAKKNIFVYYR